MHPTKQQHLRRIWGALARSKYCDPMWWLLLGWCALVFSWRAWLVWCIRRQQRQEK
jgi:hypothetical protein